jgi:hypothetical protein
MPIYCFSTKDGKILERHFPFGKAPSQIEEKGVIALRDFQAEQTGRPSTTGWPIECYASGVNAADAQKLRDEFKRCGVPTEVTINGDPVYTSHEHRKRALACRGIHDNASFN